MNLQDYQKQALLTSETGASPVRIRQHAGYGMITEIGEIVDNYKRLEFYGRELDVVNLKEEIGDTLWFIAIGYHGAGIEIPVSAPDLEFDPSVLCPEYALRKLAHHAACALAYYAENHSMDYDFSRSLYFLEYLAKLNGFTLEEAADLNIAKLRKRYLNGVFTSENAINRDKKNEMVVFESPETEVEMVASPVESFTSELSKLFEEFNVTELATNSIE